MRIRELAGSRVRYGYRRLTVLLRREGWVVNTKRVYRLYHEEGLQVRTKKRSKRAAHARVPLPEAARPNQRWSMDFVSDRLTDGRWFRILTVVDQYTGVLMDPCGSVAIGRESGGTQEASDRPAWRTGIDHHR